MQTKQENLIKILAVDQDFMGSKYHRIYLPYKALQGKEVLIESVPHTIKVDFKKCPVIRYFLTEEEFQTLEDEDNDAVALMCYKINYDLSLMLDEVKNSCENFDGCDWSQLVSILLEYTSSTLIESNSDNCDQCSNYNWHEIYEVEL